MQCFYKELLSTILDRGPSNFIKCGQKKNGGKGITCILFTPLFQKHFFRIFLIKNEEKVHPSVKNGGKCDTLPFEIAT